MKTLLRLFGLSCFALLSARAGTPGITTTNTMPSGARVMHAMPAQGWNGDLAVYVHGYTAAVDPLEFQNLHFGGVYLPELVQEMGFAFAATTYRQTGLTIVEGVQDAVDAVLSFPKVTGKIPRHVLLVGPSEGGIVTALAVERHPEIFSGGLSMCGPIGNFRQQLDYVANFRLLFDHYYPGLLPGDATNVPAFVIEHWHDQYLPLILAAVRADPDKALMLLNVASAPYEPGDMDTVENTFDQVLWYHVFGTGDATAKMGGNPVGNRVKHYRGSADDAALNAAIPRFSPDPRAWLNVQPYESSGRLTRPLITLHTTGDEVIPFWHEQLYHAKNLGSGTAAFLKIIPVKRYGHCEFELEEVLAAVVRLVAETRPYLIDPAIFVPTAKAPAPRAVPARPAAKSSRLRN